MINKIKAQSSLEIALSLICVFILLLGALNIFLWVNKQIVNRCEDYEATRKDAGSAHPGVQVDDSNETRYPELKILPSD